MFKFQFNHREGIAVLFFTAEDLREAKMYLAQIVTNTADWDFIKEEKI